ncbi:hypothetical protein [Kordia jejudonensis]|uniref:hypothetical protein n=1 Tax=Kordia jejudonensis TaxID=1348245 RepID=UPI0006296EE7|nr:hypothetical protein [Kordia jejudonensis]
MKKKNMGLSKMRLHKTRISNFKIQGGNEETSISHFVACPVTMPAPTGIACKPSEWCNSWRVTQCDKGPCAS